MNEAFLRRSLFLVGLGILVVVFLFVLRQVTSVFLLTFVAVLVGVLWHSLAKALPLPDRAALPVTFALILIGFGLLAWWFGPQLSSQLRGLAEELPNSLGELERQLAATPWGERLLERIPLLDSTSGSSGSSGEAPSGPGGGDLGGIVRGVVGRLAALFGTVASTLGDFFFVLLMSVFFAAGASSYSAGVVRLFPKVHRSRAREVLGELYHTMRGWLLGQFVSMVTVGVLVGIALSVLGVPFALGLAFLAFLLEFVPTIGPWLAGVPAVLVAASQGPTTALWVVGLFVAIELLEGNILLPLIQRRAVDLPPAVTLFAILLLGSLFGLVGVLVAAPLAATVLVLVKILYLRDVLGDEVDLPSESS